MMKRAKVKVTANKKCKNIFCTHPLEKWIALHPINTEIMFGPLYTSSNSLIHLRKRMFFAIVYKKPSCR